MANGVLAHVAGTGGGTGGIDLRAAALALAFVALVAVVGAGGPWRVRLAKASAFGAATLAPQAGLGPAALAVVAGAAALVILGPAPEPASRSGAGTPDLDAGSPWWRLAAASLVLAVVAAGGEGGEPLLDRLIGGSHVVAAAWWTGLVVTVALAWRTDRAAGRRATERVATPATVLVVVVAGTGALNTASHLGDASLALGSWWGRALAVKVALVASVAIGAALLRRGWVPRVESIVLGGAAFTGLALAAAGAPLSGAGPSGPLFLADAVVTPLAPGANTVIGEGVRIDGRAAAGEITLAEGRHTIEVGAERRVVTVKADDEGAVIPATLDLDDPDCLDRIAGATAATSALTAAGRSARLEVTQGDACVVGDVSSWTWDGAVENAVAALVARGQADPVFLSDADDLRSDAVGPVLLAPRLLDARLLAGLVQRGLTVLVAAYRDPTSQVAVDYRIAAVALGSRPPTAAGLEGYLAVMSTISGRPVPAPSPGLYSASSVAIFPAELSHPSESGWAPGVALVRVG